MNEKQYGVIEDVTNELKGKTEFDEDIENQLIERIAEIEQNNGVVEGMKKIDWSILLVMGVISIIGCALIFMFQC